MTPHENFHCDVLVVGSGIAGVQAALAAARAGCRVLLASSGPVFSGSSFYPGTWGLGLIGPENDADRQELAESIQAVGCGMAQPALVKSFVEGITPAIEQLVAQGVQMKAAQNTTQKDFIPCFDHKHRAWNGLLFASLKEVLGGQMADLGVQCLPRAELLQLAKDRGRVQGAVLCLEGRHLARVSCGALVLCTGGFGGLYQHRLTTADVAGTGQWHALNAGASLVNLEFMQMMPGYVSPCPQTIFNEKVFRYTQLQGEGGQDILAHLPNAAQLLEQRSGHGPFTSRLADREIDFAILRHQGETGVKASYSPQLLGDMPEFVRTYFDWLRTEKGLAPTDTIRIAMFAHAANGGVSIDCQGYTGVPGLYAAGEVTGGMHGADRIGGLSTANGLVFGQRAGAAAAQFAKQNPAQAAPKALPEIPLLPQPKQRRAALRGVMTQNALVLRSGPGLEQALGLLKTLAQGETAREGESAPAQWADAARLQAQLGLAGCILRAQGLRAESRGSHYRADYPAQNQGLQSRIVTRLGPSGPCTLFEEPPLKQKKDAL